MTNKAESAGGIEMMTSYKLYLHINSTAVTIRASLTAKDNSFLGLISIVLNEFVGESNFSSVNTKLNLMFP